MLIFKISPLMKWHYVFFFIFLFFFSFIFFCYQISYDLTQSQ